MLIIHEAVQRGWWKALDESGLLKTAAVPSDWFLCLGP